ncbi:unnamed protein product, partial [Ixodes pacificus]
MKEKNLLLLVRAFVVSRLAYVLSFLRLGLTETNKLNCLIRKSYKRALGIPDTTSNEKLAALGLHNTVEEIIEAERVSQLERLTKSATAATSWPALEFATRDKRGRRPTSLGGSGKPSSYQTSQSTCTRRITRNAERRESRRCRNGEASWRASSIRTLLEPVVAPWPQQRLTNKETRSRAAVSRHRNRKSPGRWPSPSRSESGGHASLSATRSKPSGSSPKEESLQLRSRSWATPRRRQREYSSSGHRRTRRSPATRRHTARPENSLTGPGNRWTLLWPFFFFFGGGGGQADHIQGHSRPLHWREVTLSTRAPLAGQEDVGGMAPPPDGLLPEPLPTQYMVPRQVQAKLQALRRPRQPPTHGVGMQQDRPQVPPPTGEDRQPGELGNPTPLLRPLGAEPTSPAGRRRRQNPEGSCRR